MPYNYPIKFGKYLLTKRIAVGGMAELFLAKMVGIKGFEKTLALKKILPEFGEDEEFVELFVDEAKITVQLQHANIVQVFDFGEIDGSYYMAMELIDGPNLKNLLKRCLKKKGFFPMEIAIYIVIQVLKALDYAVRVQVGEQELNLVHRDVSPQNVLVSREGEVKITDFGIAKATIKLTRTQPGKIQGKFSYMSPEQAVGLTIDHRSDIFSLGIIFFEMLTGFKLYTGEDTTTKYARVREAKIPPPSHYNKSIPHELETIVMKMLAKDPAQRYQSASEVLKDLNDYIYPSSTELIASNLANLTKELFPVPLSQEDEIKVGKILEAEKDRSTQTDFRLLKGELKETEVRKEEPLSVDGQKVITKISLSTKRRSKRKSWLNLLILLLVSAIAIILILRFSQPPPHTPVPPPQSRTQPPVETERATPQDTADQPVATREPEPTPTQIQTPEPTPTPAITKRPPPKPTEKPVVVKPKPTPCPVEMAFIQKGPFIMGSRSDDPDRSFGEPLNKLTFVDSFCIDIYEYPNTIGVFPKADLEYREALELCAARGKRLCSEPEWEKACKGKDSLRYPYGDVYDVRACNTQGKNDVHMDPAIIGTFDSCKSSYGVFDMSGNVAEMVGSTASENPVEKGGSGRSPGWASRCASRRDILPDMKNRYIGFRCCKNIQAGD